MSNEQPHFLRPEQLCVGLYVHLDLLWTEHPFTFSSFLIRSETQIQRIRDLGLTQVRYSPERSTAVPLARDIEAPLTPRAPGLDIELGAKREIHAARVMQRHRMQVYEAQYLSVGQRVRSITEGVLSHPTQSRHAAENLVEDLAGSLMTERDITVNLMAERIGGEDSYQHALNVSVISLMLARQLGAEHAELIDVGLGAMFHDIGKLELPMQVVRKRDGFTAADLAMFREHVPLGVAIGVRLGLAAGALDVIAHHHESFDGSGYPDGLSGDRLSRAAKIVSMANTYDNLCNPADPSRAISPHEAISQMYSQQKSRFDPHPMAAFIHCLGVYPPGTLVLLGEDVFGLVVSVNSARPLRPVVQIHESGADPRQPVLIDLEDLPELAITRTIRPSQLPRDAQAVLTPRKRFSYFFDTSKEPIITATPKDRNESQHP